MLPFETELISLGADSGSRSAACTGAGAGVLAVIGSETGAAKPSTGLGWGE